MRRYLAFDLGAESGRAMLGQFDGERLELSQIHRFFNMPVRLPRRDPALSTCGDSLHWECCNGW
jgi:rhamnulokinase